MLTDKKNNKRLIMLKEHIEYYELRRKELIYKDKELEIEIAKINKKLEDLWFKFRTAYIIQMSKRRQNLLLINKDQEQLEYCCDQNKNRK